MTRNLLAALAVVFAAGTPAVCSAESVSQSAISAVQTGIASYYAQKFEGRRTANGETFRHDSLTAAHPNLPFGTMVLVTCLERGKSVVVRITDRLPSKRAIIDLTQKAAAQLNMLNAGRLRVSVKVLSKEQAQALRDAAKDAPVAVSAATGLVASALGDESR
jgi:rare lipoprotein A